ncbi:MAG: PqqD family protein [Clostridiales bacterium]|nr:PqqD family protein [Clostridiales bacterium]
MKKSQNYLEFIPKRNPEFQWRIREDGAAEIAMPNTGFFNRLAQIIWKRPRISYIALDEFGSFIWQQIDGERTVLDISVLVKEEFGEKAEPLLERLSVFIKTLENHRFIVF